MTDQTPQNPTRPRHLLITFIVTEDGEQQHPMDAGIAKLNLTADGIPDDASVQDLVRRVGNETQRKVKIRPAGDGW